MADRSISVKFRADISDLKAKTAQGAAAIKSVADSADQAGKRGKTALLGLGAGIGKGLDGVGKHKDAIRGLSTGFTVLGVAAAAGVGVAVKSFADFDEAMSHVAATGSDASANLTALRAAALKAGADTKYSATEAAEGVEALLKAGISAKDVLGGGLTGALNLAASGNLSVADSAETVANTLNQFQQDGTKATHVADLLAQGAGTASGEVSDMAQALGNTGGVAHNFNVSMDETVEALAIFGKNGTIGAEAGTQLRGVLTGLYAPLGTGKTALKELGVSAYDSSGKIKPLGVVLDEVNEKTKNLGDGQRNDIFNRVFGQQVQAGTLLVKGGSAALTEMSGKFSQFGTAAQQAAARMDNLKGDVEQFGGSVETALIGLGTAGDGPLRTLVQGATGVVNAFSDLSDGTKAGILGVTGGLAALAISAAGIGKIAVFANEAKGALKGLGFTAKTATIATGAIGIGLTVGAAIFAHYAEAAQESKARVEDLTTSLQASSGALDENVAKTRAKSLEDSGALKAGQALGLSIADVTQASLGNVDAQARINAVLAPQIALSKQQTAANLDLSTSAGGVTDGSKELRSNIDKVTGAVSTGNRELGEAKDQYGRLAESGKAAADQFGVTQGAASGAAGAITGAGDATTQAAADALAAAPPLETYANAFLAISSAAGDAEGAIDAANAQIKGGGGHSQKTEKGRANQSALNNVASASSASLKSLSDGGASQSAIDKKAEHYRTAYTKIAKSIGYGSKAAKDLSKDLIAIPTAKNVRIVTAGAKVSADEAAELNHELKGIPAEKRAKIVTLAETKGAKAAKAAIAEVKAKSIIAKIIGDTKGGKDVQDKLKSLKKKLVDAIIKGDTSGARAVQTALSNLHDKTVHATIVHAEKGTDRGATGGLFSGGRFSNRGPLHRAGGGAVWGEGTGTSDSIPAMLSDGEFVINAKSVRDIGLSRLSFMNQYGELPGFKKGGSVSGDTKVSKAVYAELAVGDARTLKELTSAQKALDKSTKHLSTAQQSATEAIKSLALSTSDPYRSKSTDVDDVLEQLTTGAKDLTSFGDQLKQLKALGLNQDVINQITADGAVNGGELAAQIIAGGKSLVDSLNTANKGLEQAATTVGATATGVTVKGHSLGGLVDGVGTGTSDSNLRRLSKGEFVVREAVARNNLALLSRLNAGQAPLQTFAAQGFAPTVSTSKHEHYHEGPINVESGAAEMRRELRKVRQERQDKYRMGRLNRVAVA